MLHIILSSPVKYAAPPPKDAFAMTTIAHQPCALKRSRIVSLTDNGMLLDVERSRIEIPLNPESLKLSIRQSILPRHTHWVCYHLRYS